MNNMSGSLAQYTEIYWGWPIAFYLFLAGLSAGASIVAVLISNKFGKDNYYFKAAALIAPVAIILGLALLVLDLGKPLSFYWILLLYNFDSVMSIGVALLLVYTPLSVIYAIGAFKNEIASLKISLFDALTNLVSKLSGLLGVLLFILGIGVGAYTGFLLSAAHKIALWNTPVLPLLFLVSGLSCAGAFTLLLGVLKDEKREQNQTVHFLLKFDFLAIVAEFLLIVALFMVVKGASASGAQSVANALSANSLGLMFYIGVIGLGMAVPIILDLSVLKVHDFKREFAVLNAILVICGVFLLRYYIVYAGQIFI